MKKSASEWSSWARGEYNMGWYITAQSGGEEEPAFAEMLIDTGAGVTLINDSTYEAN